MTRQLCVASAVRAHAIGGLCVSNVSALSPLLRCSPLSASLRWGPRRAAATSRPLHVIAARTFSSAASPSNTLGKSDEKPDSHDVAAASETAASSVPAAASAQTAATNSAETTPPPLVRVSECLQRASWLLPNQSILPSFVHRNPLVRYEHLPFSSAVALAHQQAEWYQSPCRRAQALTHVDTRKVVEEAMADLASTFLDRGAAKWTAPFKENGFLHYWATLEPLGLGRWRRHARRRAPLILEQLKEKPAPLVAEAILHENLLAFGIPESDFTDCIRAMLLDIKGWAGMFHRMEQFPAEAPEGVKPTLIEFAAVLSILTRASCQAHARWEGWEPAEEPFSAWLARAAARPQHHDLHLQQRHSSAIAMADQDEHRQELEAEYERVLLHTLRTPLETLPGDAAAAAAPASADASAKGAGTSSRAHPDTAVPLVVPSAPVSIGVPSSRPQLQVWTCIDDRECSFRRHIEHCYPSGSSGSSGGGSGVETFGVAGFFGLPIEFQGIGDHSTTVLAPDGARTIDGCVVEEHVHGADAAASKYQSRRRLLSRAALWWERASFSSVGSVALATLAPVSLARLVVTGMFPSVSLAAKDALAAFARKPQTHFHAPLLMQPEKAAEILARIFKDIGTHNRFAPLVLVLGHGSVSANNPFASAYNCGACAGRDGGPNAALLAQLANDPQVRHALREHHQIAIPEDTLFVGGSHNTTTDTLQLDTHAVPPSHTQMLKDSQQVLHTALGFNALERCRRFLLAPHVKTPAAALSHVRLRAADLGEVRPELNHSTNAGVIVGRRSLTRGRFLDRRVFLPSYDPTADDARGTHLERVLSPALVVCSGISLEYHFSTVDVEGHGPGSKVPLNVVGNIGVLQGTTSDIRTGLPTQMTEMHTPLRSLFVVDAPVDRLEAVLARRPELNALVQNEWVRMMVRVPNTGRYLRYSKEGWIPIEGEEQQDSSQLPEDALSADSPPVVNMEQLGSRFLSHAQRVTQRETVIFRSAIAGAVLAGAVPISLFGAAAMNPYGAVIAACGTLLAVPVLFFSRRYLHGEYMYGRFACLSVVMLGAFNFLAVSPSLLHALSAWSVFGYASTFLIGAYNERPTVRNNASFAFAAYKISDFGMLGAVAFAGTQPTTAAFCLLLSALFKSSQFPLTRLFSRSMEGPTPTSALGYAGLSAHAGLVLLTSTMSLWFPVDAARLLLGAVGAYTAVHGGLVSKIRADRKGAIAYATASTIGSLLVLLATTGNAPMVLVLALGHAAYRMMQVLRAPSAVVDSLQHQSALGRLPWPVRVPPALYRFIWSLRRMDTDFHLLFALQRLTAPLVKLSSRVWPLSKAQQWILTALLVVLSGAPFTPLSHWMEHELMDLLVSSPWTALLCMLLQLGVAVVAIRMLLVNVLTRHRFTRFHVARKTNNTKTTSITASSSSSSSSSSNKPQGQ